MNIQKVMIVPICLGIFLAGIVMIPIAFAGCGPGTVLVDGVCELATTTPLTEEQEKEYQTDCGPGTVLVDGVCELDKTAKSASTSIEPLYIVIAVVTIGGVIGAIFAVRKGSKTAKPTQQEPKRVKTSVETKEASEFCRSCRASLKPEVRFCGKCGSRQ